jgi:hypothetical protein
MLVVKIFINNVLIIELQNWLGNSKTEINDIRKGDLKRIVSQSFTMAFYIAIIPYDERISCL